jgi:TolB-like protein/Tfp pilus assembly protein PilF
MTGLLAELRRRNVIRMAGLYLVGAWLVVQVAATLLPVFEAPAWVMKAVVALLSIGFFVALAFAWVFELTPEGLQRDAGVPAAGSIAPQTARRMDRLLLAVMALALAYFAFDKFVLAPGRADASATATTGGMAKPAADPTTASADPKSVAVLAFANMSADADNEYFSDGVAEEILDALAKVDGMKVAGRTASFYFKGRSEPLSVIGATLGVAHVLEGSVRKQGPRLRISAKLLRVSDGVELWSQTFDGTDADIFALQEGIARQVAGQLKVALDAGQQDRLVRTGTDDPEAYQLYLQASSIFNRRDRARFHDAIAVLQRAVELDPHYARAFARLASLHVVLASYTNADLPQAHAQAMRYAEAALAIDPSTAEAWAARGASLAKFAETQVESRDAFEQAMRIDPDDPNSCFWFGLNLLTTGYRRLGTAQIEHALSLDPMLPNALRWRGLLYLQDDDLARAEPLLQRAYDLGLANTANALSEIAMRRGDAAASERLWVAGNLGLDYGMSPDELLAIHRGVFGDAAARRAGVQAVHGVLARMGPQKSVPTLPLYLFRLDAPAEGLEVIRRREMGERIDASNWIWTRQGAPIRALPQFPEYLRAFHLPALWDKYGPPDACRKGADGDYHCD